MTKIAIIPARMGSSRFPGKPMAKILGIPMIGHVYIRTAMCKDLDEVYVATCDKEIYDYIRSIGGKAVMTADTHERCSDRTAEAMLKIESEIGREASIVVMVQGDEPMVVPEMIKLSLQPFADSSVKIVNLMAHIPTLEDFESPNEVKVVVDKNNDALYFSREPIPSRKKGVKDVPMLKQVCVIPFLREELLKFNALEPTPLEIIESVDMNRVLEHGGKIRMVMCEFESVSVDTPQDLKDAEELMAKDALVQQYQKKYTL